MIEWDGTLKSKFTILGVSNYMDKSIRNLFITLIVAVIVSAVSYHEVRAEQIFTSKSEAETIDEKYFLKFMEAVKNGDTDLLYEVWIEEKKQSTIDSFAPVYAYWNGKEITSYRKTGEERRPKNDEKGQPTGTVYDYEIVSGDEVFYLRFAITDEYKGGRYIDSYNFSNVKQSAEKNGIHNQIKPIHWINIPLAIIAIGFSLYVLGLCVKEKPKWWWGWMFFIVVIYGGISITFTEKIKIGFLIYTFYMPRISIFSNGGNIMGIEICMSVPLGAVVYWFKRRKVLKPTGYLVNDDEDFK